jgi:hypothetical protein
VSVARPSVPGATRVCPHCRATILESATICPACRHHLRSGSGVTAGPKTQSSFSPLRVEGTIQHPAAAGEAWEYSVLVAIKNERGEEIARHVVGVGALEPTALRTFTLAVEVFTPVDSKGAGRAGVS